MPPCGEAAIQRAAGPRGSATVAKCYKAAQSSLHRCKLLQFVVLDAGLQHLNGQLLGAAYESVALESVVLRHHVASAQSTYLRQTCNSGSPGWPSGCRFALLWTHAPCKCAAGWCARSDTCPFVAHRNYGSQICSFGPAAPIPNEYLNLRFLGWGCARRISPQLLLQRLCAFGQLLIRLCCTHSAT